MSNLKPASVIACLDTPNYVKAVLDASMWVAKTLKAPIGLLHAMPSKHRKLAVDYSGYLLGGEDEHLLNQFAIDDHNENAHQDNVGRVLLKQSDAYCHQQYYEHTTYTLHRHSTIAESLGYVDDVAQLIVIGNQVTCRSSLAQLIRPAKCPVLVMPETFKVPQSALFAFDNRPTCHEFLDWLCVTPLARHMTIHIVMIGKETEKNKDALREAYARLKQAGIDSKKRLIDCRDVPATLLYYQKQHSLDLMMSGAFSESRLYEFVRGSDTQQLLDASSTPYLLYPSKH